MSLKPVPAEPPTGSSVRGKPRRRRLRTIAMLPTLLTLANLYCGFGAIYCSMREMSDSGAGISAADVTTLNSVFLEQRAPSYLSIGVWLLIIAMICDALDGRVARKTGSTSNFGLQMDSLADVISFGVAPATMMIAMMHREFKQWGGPPMGFEPYGEMVVFIGLIYACCAALRLARFNVETSMDEADHHGFRGLPSPGAAGAVISVIFLHDHLDIGNTRTFLADTLTTLLPFCTLLIALLMVSRVPYRHVVSSLLTRRPLGHVILLLLVLPLVVRFTTQMAFLAAWFFVLSGLSRALWRRWKRPHAEQAGSQTSTDHSANPSKHKGP